MSNINKYNMTSKLNSSLKKLASNAKFTGKKEKVDDYAQAVILIFTDKPSITDGLVVYQSSDGDDWEHVKKYTITANKTSEIYINLVSNYLYLEYTNGSEAQNSFKMSIKYFTTKVDNSVYINQLDSAIPIKMPGVDDTLPVDINLNVGGTEGNLWNHDSVVAFATSNIFDISNFKQVSIFGKCDPLNTLIVQLSQNGVNFYNSRWASTRGRDNFHIEIDSIASKYLRLQSIRADSNIIATAGGKK